MIRQPLFFKSSALIFQSCDASVVISCSLLEFDFSSIILENKLIKAPSILQDGILLVKRNNGPNLEFQVRPLQYEKIYFLVTKYSLLRCSLPSSYIFCSSLTSSIVRPDFSSNLAMSSLSYPLSVCLSR